MQLVLAKDGLVGIAVEGLSEEDEARASREAVDIADLTVYYGNDARFVDADRVETIQFKYSPTRAALPLRASDAKETIKKFAASYRDYEKNYGAADVARKLTFELITNRPIFEPLQMGVGLLAQGKELLGAAGTQARQFKQAAGLTGKALAEFASKCRITGREETLRRTKAGLSRMLVDWSATTDATAEARLGKMRELVREKASHDAADRKVIRRVDVLTALDLSDVGDLLPCQPRLPGVGKVLDREQLGAAVALIPSLTAPLVIHAEGGVGKTVFLKSLESILSERHEVAFFDCFGGGAYRAAEDGRHLPRRGLVHIANELACRGLCDPILPGSQNTEALFTTFRRRLEQCVRTLKAASKGRELVIFIDAIDNAAEYARERGEHAFPVQLLESIYLLGGIPGVRVVASGRTHRIEKYVDPSHYQALELRAFSRAETREYVTARLPDATDIEIAVAQSRSGGNGRVLEHLISGGREMLSPSALGKRPVLDDLLRQRINDALSEARKQGYRREQVAAFLAGLSALPPPVPLDEYADAQGMTIGAVTSFASDLAPLLDRTPQGVIFRDEPTETLVRSTYGNDEAALKLVASNLLRRQDESVYAARALPGLLQKLGDGKTLFDLAFDTRFPAAISSTVGQRRIRYARLRAAVLHAANAADKDRLVELLVELSSVAASDQRGGDYIQNNPDLVVIAGDADALRRLAEIRTKWPGARHARLTVASVLLGDLDEGARHFRNAFEWVRHDFENSSDRSPGRGPEPDHIDRAAIGLFRLAQGDHSGALRFLKVWSPWYSFELCEQIFEFWRQCVHRAPGIRGHGERFLDDLKSETGLLTGAICFAACGEKRLRNLIGLLAHACKRSRDLKFPQEVGRRRPHELSDGLRKAAAIALSRGMAGEAMGIAQRAPHAPPNIWVLNDDHSEGDVFQFLFHVALRSSATGVPILERDLLPSELMPFARRIGRTHHGDDLKNALRQRLDRAIKKQRKGVDSDKSIGDGLAADADRFLVHRLPRLLELARGLAALLRAAPRRADRPFQDLVHLWASLRRKEGGHSDEYQFNYFFQSLGTTIVLFALRARDDLSSGSVRVLLKHLHEQTYLSPSTLITVISVIARRSRFDDLAGEQAALAKMLIEREDDVATRSAMFADLARAILPVNPSDGTSYFKAGLEQLDAIGSGDYDLTSELLLFAASVRGDELSEKDGHTLTNICELSMYDADKFAWMLYAEAMSRVLGGRSLAKISRWHHRGKAALEYTLLPCLTALVRASKIGLEEAIALNRLATPVDLWVCNTEAFAKAIHERRPTNEKTLLAEIVRQYEENHPQMSSGTIVTALALLARDVLGKGDATAQYLARVSRRFDTRPGEVNGRGSHGPLHASRRRAARGTEGAGARARALAARTNPLDQNALENAATQLRDAPTLRESEREFFALVRRKVRHADRQRYLSIVARLEHFDIYAKCNELEHCKKAWAGSSASLAPFYRELAAPLLGVHAGDLLRFERLSGYHIQQISDITSVPVAALTIQLTKTFASPDWMVPAAAWLGLATIVNENASPGHAQRALARLLNSGSARLTDAAQDGPWKRGLYPTTDITEVAAGLVWQTLGSPRAKDRWQAAHSVRCFARFGRWDVIDALADKIDSDSSESFGAAELHFQSLHAKLWLLIALARVAIDSPVQVAKHSARLMGLALDRTHPHVLMRHFAARAVLACEERGALEISPMQHKELVAVNESSLPPRASGARTADSGFYRGRPSDAPVLPFRFHFDYDFDKLEVHGLADVFAQPGWQVHDHVVTEVHRLDANATSMWGSDGRGAAYRAAHSLDSGEHAYGHYLAWHALFFTAADLLQRYPVTENWEHGRAWSEWLSRGLLTRKDGLWLSDGMDRLPEAAMRDHLLEKGREGMGVTGSRDKLMALVAVGKRAGRGLVVRGAWRSPDAVDVHINSALVPARSGQKLTKALLEGDDAFSMWLPDLDEVDEACDRLRTEKGEYEPWIVRCHRERGGLEDHDPLGVIAVEQRPRFASRIADEHSLRPGDPFQRTWLRPPNHVVATTEAWGYLRERREGVETGTRLVCDRKFLSRVLTRRGADLVVLIKLTRYEERREGHASRFTTTAAALRVTKNLKFEYFSGPVNQLQQSRF